MKPDKISESSGLDQEYIEKILTYIWKYPEETDEAVADRILAAGKKEEWQKHNWSDKGEQHVSDPSQSSYRWIGIRHMLFLHTHADWPPLEKKNKIWLDFVMELLWIVTLWNFVFVLKKSLDIFEWSDKINFVKNVLYTNNLWYKQLLNQTISSVNNWNRIQSVQRNRKYMIL